MNVKGSIVLGVALVLFETAVGKALTVNKACQDLKEILPHHKKHANLEKSEGYLNYQATDVIRDGINTWYLIIRFKGPTAVNFFIQKEIDYGDHRKHVYQQGVAIIEDVSSYGGWYTYKNGLVITKSGVNHIDALDIWDDGIQKFRAKYSRAQSF